MTGRSPIDQEREGDLCALACTHQANAVVITAPAPTSASASPAANQPVRSAAPECSPAALSARAAAAVARKARLKVTKSLAFLLSGPWTKENEGQKEGHSSRKQHRQNAAATARSRAGNAAPADAVFGEVTVMVPAVDTALAKPAVVGRRWPAGSAHTAELSPSSWAHRPMLRTGCQHPARVRPPQRSEQHDRHCQEPGHGGSWDR